MTNPPAQRQMYSVWLIPLRRRFEDGNYRITAFNGISHMIMAPPIFRDSIS